MDFRLKIRLPRGYDDRVSVPAYVVRIEARCVDPADAVRDFIGNAVLWRVTLYGSSDLAEQLAPLVSGSPPPGLHLRPVGYC
jgi:hypothetical protein